MVAALSASSAAVPEPTSLALLSLGGLLALRSFRRVTPVFTLNFTACTALLSVLTVSKVFPGRVGAGHLVSQPSGIRITQSLGAGVRFLLWLDLSSFVLKVHMVFIKRVEVAAACFRR
jgi:hypothetical protein